MPAATPEIVRLHEHAFRPYLLPEQIEERVQELGAELGRRFADRPVTFVVMLRGAFIFAADLIRASGLGGEVSFVRTSSYHGSETSGTVKLILPPEPELIGGRDVVLIEDIVDSGYTMQAFLPELEKLAARSVTLVTLLHKPEAQRVDVPVDLIGFTIPTKFVVGYGLDYDGLGRSLPGIYQLDESY